MHTLQQLGQFYAEMDDILYVVFFIVMAIAQGVSSLLKKSKQEEDTPENVEEEKRRMREIQEEIRRRREDRAKHNKEQQPQQSAYPEKKTTNPPHSPRQPEPKRNPAPAQMRKLAESLSEKYKQLTEPEPPTKEIIEIEPNWETRERQLKQQIEKRIHKIQKTDKNHIHKSGGIRNKDLAESLKNNKKLKKAIVMAEILGKPKGLQ